MPDVNWLFFNAPSLRSRRLEKKRAREKETRAHPFSLSSTTSTQATMPHTAKTLNMLLFLSR